MGKPCTIFGAEADRSGLGWGGVCGEGMLGKGGEGWVKGSVEGRRVWKYGGFGRWCRGWVGGREGVELGLGFGVNVSARSGACVDSMWIPCWLWCWCCSLLML